MDLTYFGGISTNKIHVVFGVGFILVVVVPVMNMPWNEVFFYEIGGCSRSFLAQPSPPENLKRLGPLHRISRNMADRLTQLQDTVNMQAEHFCNAIGIIQQTSYPSKFPNFDRTGSQTPVQNSQQEDFAQLFAQLISRCAKDIDTLIESLPNEDSSTELQNQSLKRLELENQEAAERLEEIALKGELLLGKIQSALEDIAQAQLDMQITMKSNNS